MKSIIHVITSFIPLFAFSACIETDIVNDTVVDLTIQPEEGNLMSIQVIPGLIGDRKTFVASARNDRGISFIPEVTWISSDPSILIINASGEAQLLSRGTASVMATAFDLESNALDISVVGGVDEVAAIAIVTENTMLAVGSSIQLQANALNINGDVIMVDDPFWASSSSEIMRIDESGLAVGIATGEATITATAQGVSGSVAFTVGEAAQRTAELDGLNGYSVSGSASLTMNNGTLQLDLLDNFSASSGPGLYLYLSNENNGVSGGIEVGNLNKNSGGDTYTVPGEITLDQYDYVLVYCKPFGVAFGAGQFN